MAIGIISLSISRVRGKCLSGSLLTFDNGGKANFRLGEGVTVRACWSSDE